MSRMKRFIETVSEQMGYEGHISKPVLREAQRILTTSGPQRCPQCGQFLKTHRSDCAAKGEDDETS